MENINENPKVLNEDTLKAIDKLKVFQKPKRKYTLLSCPNNQNHKVRAVYNAPLSKGWTKINGFYYCLDCKKMYKTKFEEVE